MRTLWGVRSLYLLALLPITGAAVLAVRAPRMHLLLDHWHVLAKVTDDEGLLLPAALFTYHLDQPFAIPALLFWSDAVLFAGDNRVLTVLAVVLTAAVVALLHLMLPANLPVPKKAALTTAFALLLLSPHGAELWLQSTNGISWVPALFFLVLAVALLALSWPRVRTRTVVVVILVSGATTQLLGYPKIAEVRKESHSRCRPGTRCSTCASSPVCCPPRKRWGPIPSPTTSPWAAGTPNSATPSTSAPWERPLG
ncbi:hypothetical protein [Amycolatopsis palatopharyngis]|uniref:hypothetical protein n=1 Tax=Amycolatopsis palatopharyngis TaxID=187982 RepID=UPI000E222DE6|nr:hypothetical protein [Amycolatopsis palatopharyngis]